MMYAVIRLCGNVGISDEMKDSLNMLNLENKFSCTLLPETENFEGMLKRVGDSVTWGEVEEDLALKILERGDIENAEEVIEGVQEGRSLSKIGVERSFPLSPPSGGFKKSLKQQHPRGEAGYRKDEINSLLKRMI